MLLVIINIVYATATRESDTMDVWFALGILGGMPIGAWLSGIYLGHRIKKLEEEMKRRKSEEP